MIRTPTLLDYAFGWPKGIQILLEAGADTSARTWRIPYAEDNNNEDTYHSVKLLIEAGFSCNWFDIERCQDDGSEKIKSLLINDLVARQQRLWLLAQSCLPAGQLPNLISMDEKTGKITILDVHTAEIYARLVKKGISIGTIRQCGNFQNWNNFGSVHHSPGFSVKTLEELCQVGFRDINQRDSRGLTPLMTTIVPFWRKEMWAERMHWLISKGADLDQEVPGTSSTVTHHLGFSVGEYILSLRDYDLRPKYDLELFSMLEQSFLLLPSVRDRCSCACSPGGCTTMSVLLRRIVGNVDSNRYWMVELSHLFREIIKFILRWTRGDTEIGWGVIRFLTFDALGLKHSCCVNISARRYLCPKLVSREEEEVEEIHDEEMPRILELEKLLTELKVKFDELNQPVMEFLEGYWHTRMIEVLSQRDPYDEEHVTESRRIGVTLELDECVVPDRASLLIGSKIKPEHST
ncbi:uncharacterized protein PGRI_030160 [Penicillium griseofulvum]|uniref:Ankyrin repeat-containing domain-containing protein n=1 Tax=Penicillium patulum TaxID=5078 RepID=A0A135LJJ1_PENPA|nr:uncharacterized protein PGRI_030160 [Penicillium griseofulvum]KXG49146.1 hypothetical protein PGRI_030160 [Penicillium griseofulvum]